MGKKLLGGGIAVLVIGLIFVLLVQFVIMPSFTGWNSASDEIQTASEGETMWVEGKITSKNETSGFGQTYYEYKLENVDDPTILSTEDIGSKGDNVKVEVEKTSVGVEARRVAERPPLFYIGIVMAIIGGAMIAYWYYKSGEEEGTPETPTQGGAEKTPPPPADSPSEEPPEPEQVDKETPPPEDSSSDDM